jgi:hypothetical protein
MLDELKLYRSGIRGPLYWRLPDGRAVSEVADSLLALEEGAAD